MKNLCLNICFLHASCLNSDPTPTAGRRSADTYGNAYTWTNFFSASQVAAFKQQITADCAQMDSINAAVLSAERKYLLR